MSIEISNAADLAANGTLIGKAHGKAFYRLSIVATLGDGAPRIDLESAWELTIEAELLRTRRELELAKAELEELKRPALQLPAPVEVTPIQPDPPSSLRDPAQASSRSTLPERSARRFGDEALAPSREYNLPVRPPATPAPERHQCGTCERVFDSAEHLATHPCRPVAPAPDPVIDPRSPRIPDDPEEAARELERWQTRAWPRPCPECWAQGIVVMMKGPAGMGSHRRIHGIEGRWGKNIGTPPPVPGPDGFRCRVCKSGTFAPSVADRDVCVNCIETQKR